ncbi:hypothetical protein CASFOL_008133 [Castilleja foliolosa]|uniref:B box-type domain-containing protein n=1 Tax=Castilleja foliolosa TaxID=1961234 RepID=A0ABD3DY33_9LAMI
MKRSCELCERTARIHCEPDHASLCWDCDAEVHSANFLVARHSRNLLCHVCQSPTPWSVSGSKLGATPAVCQQCAKGGICEGAAAEEMENKGNLWSPPPSSECSSSISSYESSDEEHDSSSSYFNIGAPPSVYPAEEVARLKEWHPIRITNSQRKIRRRDSGPVIRDVTETGSGPSEETLELAVI